MKKIIIVVIIILIITSIALITILSLEKKDGKQEYSTINGADQVQYKNSVERVTEYRTYISAKNCINKYLKKIYYARHPELVENESDPESTEEIKSAIIDMLYKPYIEESNIIVDNLLNKVYDVDQNYFIDILDMRQILDKRIQTYYIYGKISGDQKIYLVLYIDDYNAVFAIQPLNEEYNNIDEINIRKEIDEIEPTYNNRTIYSEVNEQTICTNYLIKYKSNLLNNTEQAYNLLEEDYRNAKFGNLENFQEYLKDNEDIIDKITLKYYGVNKNDDYTEYICQDVYENYYIFQVKSVFDYKVILDTYTIDLPGFVEVYKNASNEDRVLMNIQRFFYAIEDEDYRYAYNKLDETFKTNNFATLEEFENYAKTNFFKRNTLSAGKAEKQGNIYLYNITIKDASEESNKERTTSFVMKLGEGTDFVMSFGAE